MNFLKEWIKNNRRTKRLYVRFKFIYLKNTKSITGSGNTIEYTEALLKKTTFTIRGNNNIINIGRNTSLTHCNITIIGNNHSLLIGDSGTFYKCDFAFEDHDNLIKIGRNCLMLKHGEISSVEPFSKIEIGDDCMFSVYVDIRNTDSHTIVDLKTGQRINPGKNIKIDDKVWLGAYVIVLKGVHIEKNSVVGIRSLVTKNIPAHTLSVGSPARVLKENIDWYRERI